MNPTKVTLVVATRNAHKAGEIRAILGEHFDCLTLDEFPEVPKVLEDAGTFAGNATKKAVEIAHWLLSSRPSNLSSGPFFVIADDSGLEVDALGGAPGVHSARFAAMDSGGAGNSPDSQNNAQLLRLLADTPADRRTARFRCVLALTPVELNPRPKPLDPSASPICFADELELQTEIFEGTCEGRIDFAPRGHGGFGYDPLFIPNGFEESFAQLGEDVKNHISHRSKALAKLKQRLAP